VGDAAQELGLQLVQLAQARVGIGQLPVRRLQLGRPRPDLGLQLGRRALETRVQAGVLDRDGGVSGEDGEQMDVLGREAPGLVAHRHHADDPVLQREGDDGHVEERERAKVLALGGMEVIRMPLDHRTLGPEVPGIPEGVHSVAKGADQLVRDAVPGRLSDHLPRSRVEEGDDALLGPDQLGDPTREAAVGLLDVGHRRESLGDLVETLQLPVPAAAPEQAGEGGVHRGPPWEA